MKKISLRVFTVLGAVALTHCSKASQMGSKFEAEVGSAGRSDQAFLGSGFNKETEMFRGDCVKGTIVNSGNQQALLNWSKVTDQGSVSNSLGFSAGGRARYGLVEGSASANFAASSASNSFSEVTIYKNEMTFPNQLLSDVQTTDTGKRFMSADGKTIVDKDGFKQGCGHEFVQQITLGAALYLSVRIEFESKEAKSEFNAKFNVEGPAFQVGGELNEASKTFSKRASVSVSMFQLGGDVSKLSTALSGASVSINNADASKGSAHALAVCSMERVDACVKVISAFLDYGTNKNRDDAFPNQLDLTNKPAEPGSAKGPAVLKYITREYITAGIMGPNPAIEAGVTAARQQLANRFEDQLQHRTRVQALKAGGIRLSSAQKQEIDSIDKVLATNIAKITAAGNVCYTDLNACTDRSNEAIQSVSGIDESKIERVRLESYAQYCDLAKLPGQLKSLVATVESMNATAKRAITDIPEDSGIDLCQRFDEVLNQRDRITFNGSNISNIEPVKTLPNLTSIQLGNTMVEDISPMFSLQKLKFVTMHGLNAFRNYEDFAKIPNLESLSVNDLDALGPNGSLTSSAVNVLKGKSTLTDFGGSGAGCERDTPNDPWVCKTIPQ